jgi:hypothetical protein
MATIVQGTFSGTGAAANSLPINRTGNTAARDFKVYLSGSGSGSIQLEPGDSNWYPIYTAGVQLGLWSYAAANLSEDFSESVDGTLYRLNCLSITGTIAWELVA